jgi:ADP-heptose:LPS heptosyltransferase
MRNRFRNLRQQLYAWRQRGPLARFCAVALLLVVWPFKFAIQALLNIFARGRRPQRIIVIQLAGLGDTLMLTPALAALQDYYPEAKIDFVTLHGYVKNAFQNHPRFNAITTLPAYPGQWIISRFVNRSGLKLVMAPIWYYPTLLLKHLFARYDIGINFALSDFDRNLGNALLYCLNVHRRVGPVGLNDKLLTGAAPVEYARTQRATAYLKFLEPLGISAASRAYEFPVRQNDLETVKLALRRENVNTSRPLAVIHPGGKIHINSRRWPAEYFARVCEYLSVNEGFEIVLTGDNDDVGVCEEITSSLGTKVKSIAGRLTFAETAALLSMCQLCITNDTSTLHLAEAVLVDRVISIFGPTDPDILAPQNERHVVLRSKLPCAPCMGGIIDANTERCWLEAKEECLSGIRPEQVVGVLEQFYGSRPLRLARA